MIRKLCLITATLLASCGPPPDELTVYSLYRSPGVGNHHIHVATFDALDDQGHNKKNCEIVAGLMQEQPGAFVQYYCHAGRANGDIFR